MEGKNKIKWKYFNLHLSRLFLWYDYENEKNTYNKVHLNIIVNVLIQLYSNLMDSVREWHLLLSETDHKQMRPLHTQFRL